MNNNRILFADILRIIATFSVIIYHVCTDRWYADIGNYSEWIVIDFFVSELRWCVPMFFMLSGMNFLNPDKDITFGKLYKKYILRIVIALIFWSIIYKSLAVIANYIFEIKEITQDDIINIFISYLKEPSWFHLWYLYPLIGMYIMTPVLRIFTANTNKSIYIYLLVLYAIFAFSRSILAEMFGIYLLISLPDLIGYTGFFIAGYFFYKYDLKKTGRTIIYTIGLICIFIIFFFPAYNSYKAGIAVLPVYFGYQSILVAIITVTIFVYAKYYFINHPQKEDKYKNNKYITLLSNCSFGIYLTHSIFMNILFILKINTASFTALLSVPFMTITILCGSLALTLIIKQIPVLKKWIV